MHDLIASRRTPWPFVVMPLDWRLRVRQWAPLVLVLLGAIILRHRMATNADVSWLITLAEKALDGERLYVDAWETNPPASIFLYVVPVALARTIGLRPELVVDACIFAAAGASMWLAGRILARARLLDDVDRPSLAALVALILTIVPAQTFGEREHIVVIALLPALAVFAVRASRLLPDVPSIIAAGIGAGIAMAVKPYFVLAVGPAILAAAVCAQSWRPLLAIENWIAGAIVVLYGAVVLLGYPQFVDDVVPIVRDAYVALRLSWWTLLGPIPAALLWVTTMGLLVLIKPGAIRAAKLRPLLAASFGFGAAFVVQGKGWSYHAYPMLALAFIGLAVAWAGRGTASEPSLSASDRIKRLSLVLLAMVVVGSTFHWMDFALDLSDLVEPIRRIKANPTMLAISSDTSVGHPLVRQVGGKWVGRVGSLWITSGVLNRRIQGKLDAETMARLDSHAARDLAMLVEDIARRRPDIILVDMAPFDWLAWAHQDPTLSELLRGYQEVETTDKVLILRRVT
jgi:hypothetical protein